MKTIKAYKTKDGQIFKTRKEALNYELGLSVLDAIHAFVQKHGYDAMLKDAIVQMMFENAFELRQALKLNNKKIKTPLTFD